MLGVVDLAVADLVLASFDRAPLALAMVDLVLAVFDPGLCQVYPTFPHPLQCNQLTSGCCTQIQVAIAWDKLFLFV